MLQDTLVFWALLITIIICSWILITDLAAGKKLNKLGLSLKDESKFLKEIAQMFEALEYEVSRRSRYLLLKRNNERILVVVRLSKKLIKPTLIKDVIAAKSQYKVNKVIIVTNYRFNWVAKDLANVNKIEMWDGRKLYKEITAVKSKTT